MVSRSWHKIYLDDINRKGSRKYISNKIKEKKILINKIKKNTPKNGKILEAGCGTGVLSIYLSNLGYNVTALDVNEEILQLAKKISENSMKRPKFKQGDILDLRALNEKFDISFSSGVLEHFSDSEIIKILKLQIKKCKKVIFVVPSNYFDESEKIYGDERFLSKNNWRDLIKRSDAVILNEFEYSYKEDGFVNKLKMVFRSKLRKVKPYVGFLIKGRKSYK